MRGEQLYTALTRPNKVETAVAMSTVAILGFQSFQFWTLSYRCPVKLSAQYQPCIIVF